MQHGPHAATTTFDHAGCAHPLWPALLFALLLTACGGGGSGGATAAPGSPLRAPNASIAVLTATPVSGVAVSFDGSSSSDSDGQINSYSWNFGDGSSAAGINPSHVYGSAGDYTVTLTVTDNQGLTGNSQRTLGVGGNFAPTAAFNVSANDGQAPFTANFDAAASIDNDGSIVSYRWNFGDGSSAVGVTTQHTYTVAGTYNMDLQVTDDAGAVATAGGTVVVRPAVGNFRMAGTISILASSAVDSDVNDLNTARVSNNSFGSAQRVSNPVTVGGYINEPGSGPNGALRTAGDPADVYAINLAGGESITLTIGDPDPQSNDLDLFLYDAGGNEVARSDGVAGTEEVSVGSPGTYLVQVIPFAGASTYVLTVGQLSTSSATRAKTATEFVTGELIVQFAAGAAGAKARAGLAAANVRTLASSGAGGPLLVRVDPDATVAALGGDGRTIAAARADSRTATRLAAKLMAREPGVIAVDLNFLRRPSAVPNDSLYHLQWHLRDIGLQQAWDVTTGVGSVIVAVIDTGIRAEHPDLIGNTIAGFDFISDPVRARDGNGVDNDPTDPGDLGLGSGSSFHGTHVAGTVGARTDNGIGVAGVAWNVSLMALRVLGKGGGTSFDLIQAIRYAARLSNSTGAVPVRRADIINMSLGGGSFSQSEQNAVSAARDAGVIVVAAAGNEASAAPSYPAAYAGVVSVAASTISRSRATYSNFGATIDLTAPGGNTRTDINGDGVGDGVVSTIADDSADPVRLGYTAFNGTSMASPHVAGVAALMKSVFAAMTPAQFENEILTGRITDDVGSSGRDDQFGVGIVNANKAVARAQALASASSGTSVALLLASPASLSFGSVLTQLAVDLQNLGDAPLDLTSVESNQLWLSVLAGAVDANGLGPYTVRVSRVGLAEGSYSGVLTFRSTANLATLAVSLEVRSVAINSNAGRHYVLVVEPVSRTTVRSTEVEATNAQYVFSLADVPAGSYQIVAGSDANNDGFICDGGEACGVYRDIDSPETVILSGERSDLDFSSGFRTTLEATSLSVQPGGRAKSIR